LLRLLLCGVVRRRRLQDLLRNGLRDHLWPGAQGTACSLPRAAAVGRRLHRAWRASGRAMRACVGGNKSAPCRSSHTAARERRTYAHVCSQRRPDTPCARAVAAFRLLLPCLRHCVLLLPHACVLEARQQTVHRHTRMTGSERYARVACQPRAGWPSTQPLNNQPVESIGRPVFMLYSPTGPCTRRHHAACQ
jgi:hypothetical protein